MILHCFYIWYRGCSDTKVKIPGYIFQIYLVYKLATKTPSMKSACYDQPKSRRQLSGIIGTLNPVQERNLVTVGSSSDECNALGLASLGRKPQWTLRISRASDKVISCPNFHFLPRLLDLERSFSSKPLEMQYDSSSGTACPART